MPRRVLDVGQCAPDHGAIRRLLENHFQAQVVRANQLDDTLAALRQQPFDLVLINRKLDIDYSDGLDIVEALKADPELSQIPVMLVTNYPEFQQAAIAAGAVLGFGKNELHLASTIENLRRYLATTGE